MVKVLNRDAINRMVSRTGSSGVGGGGGGSDIDLGSYATKSWTDENYVGKEFFSSLFKAYDSNGNEVLPNDTDTQIDNIKAMFGFWTDFYISALGTGGQQSVGLRLAQLADVNVAGVTNGQVLTYDSTTGKWIASTPQSGTDMATVWANLAANGNQQINASHLSTALTGYATKTWVGQQGYITSSAISDMATKTWVGLNYLKLTGGTINGNLNVTGTLSVASKLVATQEWVGQNYISIAFFNRLFKAYNGNTQVNANDTTSTIDNIKAMFGFWTDFYISALGTGGQSTVGLRLAQLADVNVAGVTNGQVLTYNSTTGKWIASTPQSGTDMATVWANLAASGNQQINASHLSTALTGYATQTWVTNQGYITASAISDMATKTWVGQQGYITSSAISDMATKTWVGQQGYITSSALTGYATQTWVNSQISDMATKTWVNSQISDMATKTWVGQNYLSKTDAASTYLSIAFFNRLFKAYNGTTQVNPNDTATTIDNIKAMFGFWTDFYISALGTGGQSTVGLRLAQLADVNVAGVTNGQVLTYNSTTGKWIASTPKSGTDMATVWANLAASGNQQINASHLSTALTGYATQTWVGQQGYITSSAISDMATKTWVGQQGYITSSALTGYATQTWVGQQGYQTQATADERYLKLSGGTLTGKLQVNAVVFGYNYTNSNNAAAFVFDKPGSNYTGIGANGVSDQIYFGACNGDGVWQSYLQKWYFNGSLIANGDITVKGNGRIHQYEESGSILYIGSSNNYGWVRVQDMCSQDGNAGDDYWSIRTSGAAVFTSVYSKTYVTALSDARHKNVIGDTGLTVAQIAEAPAIRFTWKDRDDQSVFAGSIAQYWQKVLPEVVQSQADGTLSLDYQVAALISSITVARKVMNHESRLQRLEKMFAINEDDIED